MLTKYVWKTSRNETRWEAFCNGYGGTVVEWIELAQYVGSKGGLV
jgi:hypothetical protein